MLQASRQLLLAGLLLGNAVAAGPPGNSRPWDLDQLLGALAGRQEGTARFHETRTLRIVTAPLHTAGRLYYRRPDVLEKQVLTPREERLRIEGDRLTIEDGSADSPRSLQLSDHPALLAAIESIRAPLTGNGATLRRLFEVSLGGSERRWLLTLVPREPAYAQIVRTVQVRGSGARVESIAIEEASGDRSVIAIEPDR